MLNANKYRLSGLAIAVALSVTACGGSKNIAPDAQNVSVGGVYSWQPVQGSFAVSDVNAKDTLTITSIQENGATITPHQGVYTLSNGILTVSGKNFTYLPILDAATTIQYTVSDGNQAIPPHCN